MHLEVLGPDVNESEYEFSVNEKGQIRFGMGGIRNVGEAAISGMIEERNVNGKFKDFTDFLDKLQLVEYVSNHDEALIQQVQKQLLRQRSAQGQAAARQS